MVRTLIGIMYVLVGIVVASSNHYFANLGDLKSIVSALLAVFLWPLVLFGVNLHLGSLVKK